MSYGSKVFLPPERRLQSDLSVLYKDMCNKEIRASLEEQLAKIDPALDKKVQDLANRYHTGTNSKQVITELKRLKTNKLLDLPVHDSSDNEYYHSKSTYTNTTPAPNHDNMYESKQLVLISTKELDAHGDIHGHHKIITHHPLHVTNALQLDNQREGRSFYVPKDVTDPYEPYLQNATSSSVFNLNTPKMWPSTALAPSTTVTTYSDRDASTYSVDTHSFGKPSYSITLKQHIKDQTGKFPDGATISSRPCSLSVAVPVIKSVRTTTSTTSVKDKRKHIHHANELLVRSNSSSNSVVSKSNSHPSSSESLLPKSRDDNDTSRFSVLQNSLIQCGKLQIADTRKNAPVNQLIDRSIAVQQLGMIKHTNWLRRSNNAGIHEDDGDNPILDSMNDALYNTIYHRAKEVPTILPINSTKHKLHQELHKNLNKSTVSSRIDAKSTNSSKTSVLQSSVDLHHSFNIQQVDDSDNKNAMNSIASTQGGVSKYTLASTNSSSSTINIPNANNSDNPFRRQRRPRSVVAYSRLQPRITNLLDPLNYKDEMSIHARGHYNVTVKPSLSIGTVPSKSEVNHILETLTRKAVLSYNTRIVECGSALKALKDPRYPTPGLQAIFSLHKAFINAASSNANNWLLNRNQISEVLTNHVPWLAKENKHRLLLSFDAQNTGLIRYVRLSTTLLCSSEPAMIELCTTLNRTFNGISKQTAGLAEGEENILDCLGELVLISLIHGFYEECSGGTVLTVTATQRKKAIENLAVMSGSDLVNQERSYTNVNNSTTTNNNDSNNNKDRKLTEESDRIGVGMRLQDFVEAFSCCATSIEDEVEISHLAVPVMQYLFEIHHTTHKVNPTTHTQQSHTTMISSNHLNINKLQSKSRLLFDNDENNTTVFDSVEQDSFADLSQLELLRGDKLAYRYKNGEQTITKGDKVSILSHPLRTKADGSNSIIDLINEPMNWKKKILSTKQYQHQQLLPQSYHQNDLKSNSSILLPGGNSMIWNDSGNTVSSGNSTTTSATLVQSKFLSNKYLHLSDPPLANIATSSNVAISHPTSSEIVIDVEYILKHGSLASIKALPRISKDVLIDTLKKYPKFLKEFVRQVRVFREAAKPYIYFGSKSIDDSISQFNTVTSK